MKTDARAGNMLVLSALLAVSFLAPSAAERPKCMGERATIVGTNGTERLVGTNKVDVIVGRGGSDYIVGKAAADLICGGGGDDHLDAGDGRGRIKGGGGDDTLVGGDRTEALDGGAGNDIFFTRGGQGGSIHGREGDDWLTFVDRNCKRAAKVDLRDHTVRYRNCAGTKTRHWTIRSVDNVEGGLGADVLTGSHYSNRLMGQERDDTLKGARGNDRLHGGDDFDRGRGGDGDDVCVAIESRRSC